MNGTPTPAALAAEFSRVLRQWLTPAEVRQVCALNSAEQDAGVCHSGDLCDSNMAMDAAFRNLGRADLLDGYDVENGMPQATADLWNAAWSIAKAGGFELRPTGEA